MHSYQQKTKNNVRNEIIKAAVRNLTVDRSNAAVVSKKYVRDIYDYYNHLDEESKIVNEVNQIDINYINDWELLHDSFIKHKSPSDLTVCYLCGPEPNNDFNEFISQGILPHNIWAFESNNSNYNKAIDAYIIGEYPQPRIIKQNIETFFENTPKTFDIIYLDSCGTIPSDQHTLRCIYKLFKKAKLNSPGVLITNFSTPEEINDVEEFVDLITMYEITKKSKTPLQIENGRLLDEKYKQTKKIIKENFEDHYSEFISSLLRDIPTIVVPLERIMNNTYIEQLFEKNFSRYYTYNELIELAKNNDIARFVITIQELIKNNVIFPKISKLFNEIGELDNVLKNIKYLILLQSNSLKPKPQIEEILGYFNKENIYQFLDNPREHMFYDIVINQLAYPMHYNYKQSKRIKYVSKSRTMMVDLTTYDECRYIYEWLPAMHQIRSAIDNKSWQYVFRFSLDGLIKSRILYNNELFFQGSVIGENIHGFCPVKISERVNIE